MLIRATISRLLSMFRRRQRDDGLDEEIRAHLELLAADYERRGMTRDQARHAARREFGGVQQMKEIYRDRSSPRWLKDAQRDVHHALRTLRRAPVFTGAAVLTMAVGLTAVVAIFAILSAFMLRPMPVDRPEQLVSIGIGPDRHVSMPHGVSFVDLQDYRQERATFVDTTAWPTKRRVMVSICDHRFRVPVSVFPMEGVWNCSSRI